MSNPSCNSQTQVYWNGTSFFSATAFFSDSALTNPSPDGWYVFGGVVRQILNGVLLSAVPCESCVIPCEDPIVFPGGLGGQYTLNIGFGNKIGAGIITFNTGMSNSNGFPVPDQCIWEYNGNTASKYSSLLGGYITGLIGIGDGGVWNPPRPCFDTQSLQLLNAPTGSNGFNSTGTFYPTYDAANNNFAPVGGTGLLGSFTGLSNNTSSNGLFESTLISWNCSNQTSKKCSIGTALGVPSSPYNPNLPLAPNLRPFSAGTPTTGTSTTNWPKQGFETRNSVMVIPAPPNPGSNVATITITGPCYSTLWAIDIQCPELLAKIPCSTEFGVLEYDQSPGGQASKTPLYTTFMASGTTSCGPFPNTLPCLNGKLTDDTVGVNFNNPILFPPVGVSIGDLVQDPATGFYATVTNVASSGSVLTIENLTTGQDAVTAFAQTGVPYDIYRKGVCSYQLDKFIYHVPVDAWGNANPNSIYYTGDTFPNTSASGQPKGILGLGDWVFEDEYGVTPVAVGVYKTQFDANDGLGVRDWAVQVGPREYKDVAVSNTVGSVKLNALPPEDYVGQIKGTDWPAPGITFNDVQKSGARVPGVVRSITPCDPPESFDCDPVTFLCSDPGTGLGQYTSLVDCNNNCTPPPSWDCISPGNCQDPGTGLGQYTSLSACQSNCVIPPSFDCDSSGTCSDPGTGLGQYSTLSACNTACTPVASCSDSFATGTLDQGQYNIDMDAGSATGAVILRLDPWVVPDRCTWTYDGVSASEYSSPVNGYLQGFIGTVQGGGSLGCGDSSVGQGIQITNAAGSGGSAFNGIISDWDLTTSAFVQTSPGVVSNLIGPIGNQASGDVTLVSGNPLYPAPNPQNIETGPGFCMMVVPKPYATPSLVQIMLEGPCGDTKFDFEVNCPVELPRKDRGELIPVGECGVYTHDFYTASPHYVDGISLFLDVHDWVFEDMNGVTPLPPGDYPAKFPGGPNRIITVANGVITAMVAC